jgi:colanic acid/amylovoran biosynthesis glycosyltransferase
MSEDMKDDLVRIGCSSDKIMVHYYGTDVQQFNTKRDYNAKDETVFLSVGYLVPQKGHAFTLRAFKKALRMTNRKMKLRIVGEGYLEPDLKGYVAKNGLMEHVDFIGSLTHLSHEFFVEFRKADVFIHPSVTSETNEKEGIPGAVVEAMASGLPVISTFHAGIPYVIRNDETGMLVNEWDIDKLAECIVRLSEDTKLRERIGSQAQRYAIEKLDLKQKQKELENIYDRVIEEHKTRC